MNEDVQQRLTQAGERLNTSVVSLGNFAASRLADIVERSVDLIERAVQNVTGQTSTSTATQTSSSSDNKSTGGASRKRPARSPKSRRTSRASASTPGRKRAGPAPLSTEKQAKIQEGFKRGLTTKKIAEFAGVSHSSAIRYTRHLRK